MNDLNQIIRNNEKAGADDIPKQRAAGKFIVSHYAGVSYLSHSVFDTAAEAETYFDAKVAAGDAGERYQYLEPIVASEYIPSGDEPATLESLSKAASIKKAATEKAVGAKKVAVAA